MDNEEKTNEEPQKPDGFTPGIERMTEKLENIFSTAIQALQVAPNLESGGHKWMVLSKALGEIRHILGPCAIMPDACFHKLHEFVCQPPASGTGEFFTKKETLDFLVGNPPFGDVKDAATPLDPSVQTGGGCNGNRGNSYMSKPEAAYILCRMATSRKCDVSGVTALQMGVRSLMKRHFDRQRNWARRRARAAGEAEEKQNV